MKKPGELLKEFRSENGLTLKKLAEILVVSQQQASRLELNERNITEDNLKKLKEYMNYSKFIELNKSVEWYSLPERLREKLKISDFFNEGEKENTIPYFKDIYASAGNGWQNFCDIPTSDRLEVPSFYCKRNMAAINVDGDSMYPELKDRDIVIVNCEEIELNSRSIFVVKVDEEIFIKKLILKNGELEGLESINVLYPPRKLNSENKITVLGKIEGVYRVYKN
ncbi:MAG: LexA family transcriptional regulator [Clostridium sp.]|uniref:LexA family transcriptional regulator n=1 Tax=Clostridium sp. TaxID=1506 RepID=UPI003F3FEB8C